VKHGHLKVDVIDCRTFSSVQKVVFMTEFHPIIIILKNIIVYV